MKEIVIVFFFLQITYIEVEFDLHAFFQYYLFTSVGFISLFLELDRYFARRSFGNGEFARCVGSDQLCAILSRNINGNAFNWLL